MPENNTPSSSGLARLLNAVLGTDPQQRVRVSRALMAAFVYAMGCLLCEFGLRQWPLPTRGVRLCQLSSVLAASGMYLAVRTGWSQRFADPSLAVVQIMVAQVASAMVYAVMSPVRGAMLSLQVMIALFAISSLGLRAQLQMAGNALLVMGLTMVALTGLWPQTYAPAIEWTHFTVLLTILVPVSLLGVQLTTMRARLATQKAELETALERIQTLVNKDEMTGLLNRRAMRDMAMHHLKLQSRSGDGSVLALINLDAFKRINDLYGHAVGDDALRLFAQEVRKVLRDTDLVARWGGEEFLILLTATTADQALVAMDRVRDGLMKAEGPPQAPDLRVHFSAGVAEMTPLEPLDNALERAEAALHRAKVLGRNRSELALEPALSGVTSALIKSTRAF
jgi:diguanylate cyclase